MKSSGRKDLTKSIGCEQMFPSDRHTEPKKAAVYEKNFSRTAAFSQEFEWAYESLPWTLATGTVDDQETAAHTLQIFHVKCFCQNQNVLTPKESNIIKYLLYRIEKIDKLIYNYKG